MDVITFVCLLEFKKKLCSFWDFFVDSVKLWFPTILCCLLFCTKFDCNFFNHFPCLYVGLFVRDKCERLVKNQVSKGESVEFATSSQVAHVKKPAKRPHVEHMTRSWRVMPSYQVQECFTRRANPRSTHETFCLAKSCVALPNSLPTL